MLMLRYEQGAQLVISRFMLLKTANEFTAREMISQSAKVWTGGAVGILLLFDLDSH